jgi:signal transduction histidine kinase
MAAAVTEGLKEKVTSNFIDEVFNPARLAALQRLNLLDTPAEAAFDRLGQLAQRFLKTPVALVTLVDDQRQFFKSCLGLPEPWATWRSTPLSHSFCKHVVSTNAPLVVNDARENPVFRENLAIKDLGIVAYLGVPLRVRDQVLGSFCVIDSKPHDWTAEEVQILSVLAESVMTEIALRGEIETSQEALDQLSQVNEALNAFSHTVAHDLRSALTHIDAFAVVLRDECAQKLTPECNTYAQSIHGGVKRASGILDALMRLAQVSTRPLQITTVNLSALVSGILRDLQQDDPTRNVTTHVEPDVTARADEGLMRVAMENLLKNAWKFTSRQRNAFIEFGRLHPGDTVDTFFIRDNGVGFDAREAKLLFTAFARLSSARDFPGTGIGLQTVRRIIERHGGRVWAEPGPESGATFLFTLGAKN